MERIFINREWCIDYVLLALNCIENSANKEMTIEEFIKEIETMFDIYTDDTQIKNIKKKLIKKFAKRRVKLV